MTQINTVPCFPEFWVWQRRCKAQNVCCERALVDNFPGCFWGRPWGAVPLLPFRSTLNRKRTDKAHAKWRWWLLSWSTWALSGRDRSAASGWQDAARVSVTAECPQASSRPLCHSSQLSMTIGRLKETSRLLSASLTTSWAAAITICPWLSKNCPQIWLKTY